MIIKRSDLASIAVSTVFSIKPEFVESVKKSLAVEVDKMIVKNGGYLKNVGLISLLIQKNMEEIVDKSLKNVYLNQDIQISYDAKPFVPFFQEEIKEKLLIEQI